MATRIKLIVIFNLLWSEFDETNETFRSASTDLDHALVVCDLLQSKLDITINIGLEFYLALSSKVSSWFTPNSPLSGSCIVE